jgi:6-phosphogluconolactonase
MLKIFEDKTELAKSFCEELKKLSQPKEKFCIALSGGSTPKIVFQTLAKNYSSKINWNKIQLFWGDERCVPPFDDESNYGMTKKNLLDFIDIPANNVHRIYGENDPEQEAERYSEEIKNIVDKKNGLPGFDIIMLGLGDDGHIASIFPNQFHLLNSDKICEVAIHPYTNQKRITLTGTVINNSLRIIFLVTGESKALILKETLVDKNKIYPSELIQQVSGSQIYYVDQQAAKHLT